MTETASVQELVDVVPCPACGAPPGVSCAETLRMKASTRGDAEAARELAAIARAAPHLSHPERFRALEEAVDAAVAYGLVRRVPARRRRAGRGRASP